jgi:DNA-binding winged helix-turn-helix (wHTH) protein
MLPRCLESAVDERPRFPQGVLKGLESASLPVVPSAPPAQGRLVAFGPFTFDRVSRLLRRDGVEVPLPPRVLGVLVLLLEPPGEVVTKQALITAVWRDAFVTETSIAEAISVLRQTLGDDPQRPTYVQTLHRRGYRFIADVVDADAKVPPPALATSTGAQLPAPTAADVPADPEPRLSLLLPWTIALFAVLTAAMAVWRYAETTDPVAVAPVRFSIPLPDGVTMATAGAPLAVSNDGSTIAFAGCDLARCAIYLRPLSQPDATPVAGTTGGTSPFFSVDGRALGFFAEGRLRTIALGGGAPVDVAAATEALGAAWLPDGRIVFARDAAEGLFVVGPTGENLRTLTMPSPGQGGHRWPASAVGGEFVVFSVSATPAGDERYGALVSLRTGSWGRILDGVGSVRVPTPDHLLAQRGDGLVASWLDARTHALIGLPVPVASPGLGPGAPRYAVNDAGTLVTVAPTGDALHVVLHWAGELRRLVPPPQPALPR